MEDGNLYCLYYSVHGCESDRFLSASADNQQSGLWRRRPDDPVSLAASDGMYLCRRHRSAIFTVENYDFRFPECAAKAAGRFVPQTGETSGQILRYEQSWGYHEPFYKRCGRRRGNAEQYDKPAHFRCNQHCRNIGADAVYECLAHNHNDCYDTPDDTGGPGGGRQKPEIL